MTKIAIDATYYAGTVGVIDLPDGVVWADIKEWYVKWDCFHFTLGNNEWQEVSIDSGGSSEVVDWKRPKSVTVYAVNEEDEEVDWNTQLAEA